MRVRRVGYLTLVALLAAASAATASSKLAHLIRTKTVACTAKVATISFDPRSGAEIRSGSALLGTASFTSAELSRACTSVPEPVGYVDPGLGSELRRAVGARCTSPNPLRLPVNAITEKGKSVGSNLLLGTGRRMTVIASAVLKNKGDAKASGIYIAHRYCRLV